MPAAVTWDVLRELAAFRAHHGCALSVYLDLDPSTTPTTADLETRLRSVLDRVDPDDRLPRDHRAALRDDVDRVYRYVDEEFERDGTRGLAVFSSTLDNLWQVVPLAEPVPDDARVARDLYLAPLVPLVDRGDGDLVAAVSRERGEVYRLRSGVLRLLDEQSDEQPGRHDQGGWSQSRYQRRIEGLVRDHLKDVAERLDLRVRRLRPRHVVVVCAEELRPEFEQELSNETLGVIAGWTTAEAHAGPPELLDVARPMLDAARGREQAQVVERWQEEAGRDGRAVHGWAATIEAACDGRVDVLLARPGTTRQAWQCPECGRGAMEAGSCPLDGTAMELHDDALDLAIHQTLAHGGAVTELADESEPGSPDEVAALLRY